MKHPGVRFTRIVPGERLPLPTRRFNIAFNNAVSERVVSREGQRRFFREMLRVAERFFAATPNRWVLVETHTCLPLVHYLPAPAFRGVLGWTGHRFWAREENLNLLSPADLANLFPPDVTPTLEETGVGWPPACRSNLVAYGTSGGVVSD